MLNQVLTCHVHFEVALHLVDSELLRCNFIDVFHNVQAHCAQLVHEIWPDRAAVGSWKDSILQAAFRSWLRVDDDAVNLKPVFLP